MNKFLGLVVLTLVSIMTLSCSAQVSKEEIISQTKKEISEMENQKNESLKTVVQNFYDALSTTPTESVFSETEQWMASDWKSSPTPPGGENLDGFVKTLQMFHGMIPDLNWKVEEMLVDGNRVIVRSQASGTPNSPEGYFFGVPTDGSRSFQIQTIDIHTVENGKMIRSFHTEDWATAIQQVSSK